MDVILGIVHGVLKLGVPGGGGGLLLFGTRESAAGGAGLVVVGGVVAPGVGVVGAENSRGDLQAGGVEVAVVVQGGVGLTKQVQQTVDGGAGLAADADEGVGVGAQTGRGADDGGVLADVDPVDGGEERGAGRAQLPEGEVGGLGGFVVEIEGAGEKTVAGGGEVQGEHGAGEVAVVHAFYFPAFLIGE